MTENNRAIFSSFINKYLFVQAFPGTFIFELFFWKKKYLLVGTSHMLCTVQWASQLEMYVCHTNQIGSTINSQSNFLL